VGLAKKEGRTCVSHEWIYQYIWTDKKQGGDLYEHLRCQGKSIENEETQRISAEKLEDE
jgi:IS30 family transposase